MFMTKTFNASETNTFAGHLVKVLDNKTVICLSGDLGAGKTLFVQGIAQGLAVDEPVTSPTFNIMNIYHGRYPIYHFDLYRLDFPEQLEDIGFFEYIQADGIIIIEWADKFAELMPQEYLWIDIKRGGEENERLITMKPVGQKYIKMVEELNSTC